MGCVRVSFKEVDQKIRLHQNLIVQAIYALISMMMAYQIADPFDNIPS